MVSEVDLEQLVYPSRVTGVDRQITRDSRYRSSVSLPDKYVALGGVTLNSKPPSTLTRGVQRELPYFIKLVSMLQAYLPLVVVLLTFLSESWDD